eukprot:1161171-Pelagomonas_calceolata.AAC.18
MPCICAAALFGEGEHRSCKEQNDAVGRGSKSQMGAPRFPEHFKNIRPVTLQPVQEECLLPGFQITKWHWVSCTNNTSVRGDQFSKKLLSPQAGKDSAMHLASCTSEQGRFCSWHAPCGKQGGRLPGVWPSQQPCRLRPVP